MTRAFGNGLADHAFRSSEAFNAGCDARIAGAPRSTNPYDRTTRREENESWDRGWCHVQNFWGCDARRGRVVVPIPWVPPEGRVRREDL